MHQGDLFASLNLRPKVSAPSTSIQQAVKKVEDAKRKYQPSVILPQYSILRQKIILIQNLVRQKKITPVSNYFCIRDKDTLWKLAKNIKASKYMPWDSETDSLDPITTRLVGLSIFDKNDDKSYYIPFIHCDTQRNILPDQLTYEEFVDVFGEIFQDSSVRKITHNGVFDNRVVHSNLGLNVKGQYWDTLLFMNAIDENHKNNKLKHLYKEFVDPDSSDDSYDDLFENIPFCFIPIDIGYIYAAGDAHKTDLVKDWQYKMLSGPEYSKMLKHYIDVEAPQLEIVTSMEDRGIAISIETANKLDVEYKELEAQLRQKLDDFFFKHYGLKGINYNSSQQMAEIIYDKMRCEPVDKKNPRGTGEEIIEKLVAKNPEVKILKDLLTYRGTTKLINTYIEALPQQVNKKDNAIHAKFNSHGARTGRYSSNNPNLQNIPSHYNEETGKDDSRIRQIFVPRPGYVFISSDYSQIEPRILAFRSNDTMMLDAYNNGQDLYSLMASGVYKLPYEECLESYGDEGARRRKSMKSVLLGLMYGRQPASIGQQLHMNKRESEKFVDNFYLTYPNIKAYIDETIRMGTLLGYVTTLYGRRRRLPDLNSTNEFLRAEAQRQAVNATIQGSSAEITKKAMLNIYRDDWLNSHDCHLLITIHDETITEVPIELKDEAGERIRSLMIQGAELLQTKMPIKCDVEIYEQAWNLNGYKLKKAV